MATSNRESAGYTLSNTWDMARERLSAGAAWLDPWTIATLELIGIDVGCSCLEIGGGAGSITSWLCSRVGTGGRVVATDVEPQFLLELQHSNLEVLQHDVATDPLPHAEFDLVYARLVLSHLPQREAIIGKLVQALKPGGWLLIEELDQVIAGLADPASDPDLVANLDKLDAMLRGMASKQMTEPITTGMGDVNLGRRLHGIMQGHGLERIVVEGHCSMSPGGSPYAHFMALTNRQVRQLWIDAGLTDADIDAGIAALEDPRLVAYSRLFVSARGQRPMRG